MENTRSRVIGKKEGIKEGEKKGKIEGKKEGILETKKEIIKQMLNIICLLKI